MMLKYVNATNRSIYAFELTDPPDAHTSIPDGGGDRITEAETCQNSVTSGEEVVCTICLEECDGELKKHGGNDCNFIMCDPCAEVSCLVLYSVECPIFINFITPQINVQHLETNRTIV